MRLALITPGFAAPDEDDFAIPALTGTVRRLALDHEVHVFTLRYPHRRGGYDFHGARVTALGWGTGSGLSRLRLLQLAVSAIRKEHRRQPFDLMHGLWADEPGFVAVTAGRLLGRPAVVSILGGELVGFPDITYGGQLSRANRWLTGQALRRAALVTAGSEYLRRIAAPHVSGDRLRVLPLGVDTGLFNTSGSADVSRFTFQSPGELAAGPAFHILHAASLSPVKDQSTLLRALEILVNAHPEVHLHIVGTGPLLASLTTQAGDQGIAPHVTFHGQVAHRHLPDWYRAADLFVLSSRYESQSLVALEAAACGCPVAGTAVGVLPELLPCELVAPVGNPGALAGAVCTMIENPAYRAAAAGAGQSSVNARYSLELTSARLHSLYQELATGAY